MKPKVFRHTLSNVVEALMFCQVRLVRFNVRYSADQTFNGNNSKAFTRWPFYWHLSLLVVRRDSTKALIVFFFVECFQSNLLLLFVVVSCLVLTKLLSVFKLFIDMFCIIHHFYSHQSDIHGPRYKWYPYFENVHPVNMKHLKVAWKIKKKSRVETKLVKRLLLFIYWKV